MLLLLLLLLVLLLLLLLLLPLVYPNAARLWLRLSYLRSAIHKLVLLNLAAVE